MFGLLRAYGTDNGSDSESGPDGNGHDDIPSYGTQFDKCNLQKEPHSDNDDGRVAWIHWMEINREMTKITWSPMMQSEKG